MGIMNYDDIYEYIGEFGTFQICVFSVMMVLSIWGTEVIGMNFIAGSLDHWCKVPGLEHLPFDLQKHIAIPHDGEVYSSCSMYDMNYSLFSDEQLYNWNRSWTENKETIKCSAWTYGRSVFSMTTVNRFDLVCDKQFLVQLPATMFMVGLLIGVVLSGALSDKFGRRRMGMIHLGIKILGAVLSTMELNYVLLLLGRLILGFGNSGAFLCGYVLVAEITGPKYRTFTGVTLQIGFSIGFMLQTVIAYFVRDDIKFQAASTSPFILFVLFYLIMPESPRWLILRERYDDANLLFTKMASVNQRRMPLDFDTRKVKVNTDNSKKKGTCLDLLRTPRMRIRTIAIDFAWFTASLVFYGMSLNAGSLSGNLYLNCIISGAVEIPANILCIIMMDWRFLGRRITNSGALILAGILSFINIPLILFKYGTAATCVSMIGKGAITVTFSAVYVVASEIFPTEVRNVGMGTASMWARVAGMIAPYVGGPLNKLWRPLPSLVFGLVSTLSGLMCLLVPETLGHELLDTIEEAEKFPEISKSKTEEKKSDREIKKMDSSKFNETNGDSIGIVYINCGLDMNEKSTQYPSDFTEANNISIHF